MLSNISPWTLAPDIVISKVGGASFSVKVEHRQAGEKRLQAAKVVPNCGVCTHSLCIRVPHVQIGIVVPVLHRTNVTAHGKERSVSLDLPN